MSGRSLITLGAVTGFVFVAAVSRPTTQTRGPEEKLPYRFTAIHMVPVPEKVYTNIHARQRWDTMWQSDWVTLPPAKRNNDTLNFETTEHGFIIQNQPDGGYTLVRPALRFDIARYQDLALFGEIVEDNHPIVTCDLDETIDPLPWSRARVFRIVPDGPNIVIASIVFANVHTEHTRRARIDVLAHTK